ncbi:protein Hook homolog 3-like [Dysidea avara]|uniref:protein Hook homolog 3-like n=1 Tax=Dysidea avara TaxID=196820 RepID=UPI00331DB41C
MAASNLDDSQLCESLIKWINTFNHLQGNSDTVLALSDGVAIASCLCQLDSIYFNQDFSSRVIKDVGGNWRIRVSNLKKVLKAIVDYLSDVHQLELDSFPIPDVNEIGEKQDEEQMGRLLQLVLGIAIHCDGKEEYIRIIQSMEESVQHVVMAAIQHLLTSCMPSTPVGTSSKEVEELQDELKRCQQMVEQLQMDKETLKQQCHDLQQEFLLEGDKQQELQEQIKRLKDEIKNRPSSSGTTREHHQRQLEQLRSVSIELESSREDYRLKVDELNKEMIELRKKNQDLLSAAEHATQLQDELDVTKQYAGKAKKYDTLMESYQKKKEEAQEMRRQIKSLEDINMSYTQQTLDLEEQLRRMKTMLSQVDVYRKKVQELEKALTEEKMQSQQAIHEARQAEEKLAIVQEKFKEVSSERDELISKSSLVSPAIKEGIDFDPGWVEPFTPELKKKMAHLEKENEILQSRLTQPGGEEDGKVLALQGLLEDSKERNKQLEQDLLSARKQVLELKSPSLRSVEQSESDSKDTSRVKKLETLLTQANKDIESLKQESESKDKELEKHKKTLIKAKRIIEDLKKGGAGQESSDSHAKVVEKDRIIEKMEKEMEQARIMRDREEKLIVTAWYEMGMQISKKFADQRITTGTSLLSQQRQALAQRMGTTLQTPSLQ